MIEDGWILRNEIIWHKGNAFPQGVKDRFTNDFEKIFFFVKNKKYFFNQQFEPYTTPLNRWGGDKIIPKNKSLWDMGTGQKTYRVRNTRPNPKGRNKRCVWTINTKPLKEAHFASFPEELVETCLDAGCPEGGTVLDPFMGSGTTAVVAIRQNKNFIGFELNPDYIEIANKRIQAKQVQQNLVEIFPQDHI
jgi:site-specific DNA-methyltransferase (adenine-specific)